MRIVPLPRRKPPNLTGRKRILDFDPSKFWTIETLTFQASIAEQSSLLEIQFIKQIQPDELLGQAWLGPEKQVRAPVLLAYIDWFTKVIIQLFL